MNPNSHELDCGWEISEPNHLALYRKAEPLLQTRHNALHTRISYRFALVLLEQDGGDADVVFPAILLHDLGWSVIPEKDQLKAFGPKIKNMRLQRLHETEGARLAKEILVEMGYGEDSIREVENIIDGHDTRTVTLGINDSVVKDADKLWRYTHEGFNIDCRRFNRMPEKHLDWLVDCITGWFFTETGRQLAHAEAEKRRIELCKDY